MELRESRCAQCPLASRDGGCRKAEDSEHLRRREQRRLPAVDGQLQGGLAGGVRWLYARQQADEAVGTQHGAGVYRHTQRQDSTERYQRR